MSAHSRKLRHAPAPANPLRFENLEQRRALAVTAALEAGTLRIALDAADDFASLGIEAGRYVVSTATTRVSTFATGGVNAIVVDGSPAAGQVFVVADGPTASIVDPLTISASVEATTIRGRIDTAGAISIASPQIDIARDVQSAGTQEWGGAVRLLPPVLARTTRIPLPPQVDAAWGYASDSDVSGDGKTLILTWQAQGAVALVDVGGTKPPVVIPCELADSVAASHDGQRAYVAHNRIFSIDNIFYSRPIVSEVDLARGVITRSLELPIRASAGQIAVSPDGRRIYLACDPSHDLWPRVVAIDVGEPGLTLAGTIVLPERSERFYGWGTHVAVSPDGRRVFVADRGANFGGITQTFIDPSVSVVDCDTLRVTGTIQLSELGPGGLQDFWLAPDGRTAFGLGIYNTVCVIDLEQLVVSRQLYLQSFGPDHVYWYPRSFHVAASGTSLLINYNGKWLVDVDPVSGRARHSWPLNDGGAVFGTPSGTMSFVRVGSQVMALESPRDAAITLSGKAVTFSQTVDGPAGLVVRSRGATVLGGAAGAATPLARFATDAGGTAELRSVTTTGSQRYADDVLRLGGEYRVTTGQRTAFEALGGVQFTGDVSLVVADGDVTFARSIDAAPLASGSLSIRSNGGGTNVALRGRIGGTAPLSGMELQGVAGVVAAKAVTLDGTPSNSQLDGLVIGPGVHNVRFTARGSSIRNFRGRGIDLLGDSRNSALIGFTISNNAVHGIRIRPGDQGGTVVSANTIDNNGNRSTGTGDGVLIQGFGVTLSNNTIRGNGRAGISLQGSGARAVMLSNSITANGLLGSQAPGIRMVGSAAPSPPIIESVRRQGNSWKVTLRVPGEPTQRFRLQLFASTTTATDSMPQGERLVADGLNAAGGGTVTLSMPVRRLKTGDWLTATATELNGATPRTTSALSNAVQ